MFNPIIRNEAMGRARNIAQKCVIDQTELNSGLDQMYVFTENEFRQFVHFHALEQRIICGHGARLAITHPLSEAVLAGDIIEAAESPEIF